MVGLIEDGNSNQVYINNDGIDPNGNTTAIWSNDENANVDVIIYLNGNDIMLKCKSNSSYENYYIRILFVTVYFDGVVLNSSSTSGTGLVKLELQQIMLPADGVYAQLYDNPYINMQGILSSSSLYSFGYYKLTTTAVKIGELITT